MSTLSCTDPIQYCKVGFARLGIDYCFSDSYIMETFEKYAHVEQEIAVIWTLRTALAEISESLILLDRQRYLIEQGCNCSIRSMVDSRISPRNQALMAFKQ